MKEYMTDEELLSLICDIEENNLVEAPPQLAEEIFEIIDNRYRNRLIEYRRFRNKVIVSVAAILFVTLSAPGFIGLLPESIRESGNRQKDFALENEPDEQTDTMVNTLFEEFGQSHYISSFLNGRED